MPNKMSSSFCKTCNKQMATTKVGTHHVLHLLLTVLCCGWWLPIWGFATLASASVKYKCTGCGLPSDELDGERIFAYGLLIASGILILMAIIGTK